ncbi:MAG TPA: hypothetical protein VD866_23255 [Urbifossiella sp.]|nr:hypothetical protein [Urbifossiella sp.]
MTDRAAAGNVPTPSAVDGCTPRVPPPPRFRPGTVAVTLGAMEIATTEQVHELLTRHLAGDWGDVDAADVRANEAALWHGLRVLSSYKLPGDRTLWVLAEAERSATTVLTRGEY